MHDFESVQFCSRCGAKLEHSSTMEGYNVVTGASETTEYKYCPQAKMKYFKYFHSVFKRLDNGWAWPTTLPDELQDERNRV